LEGSRISEGCSGISRKLLHLPQPPPGDTGSVVVLVMIAEKVTAEKRQEMVFFKGPGFVLVVVFMPILMRYVGAKVEQLEG
jgi:hypothetical protein